LRKPFRGNLANPRGTAGNDHRLALNQKSPYRLRRKSIAGKACNLAARTLPVIVGFTVGCGLGAACEAALGTWSLALPAGLAMLAFAIGFAAERDDGPH
jgi:hypothetical protein